MYKIKYKPSDTLKRFHDDNSFIKAVMGPIGSGKTTACCFELMKRIIEHPINPENQLSQSRALIVRNSYQELKDTTLNTWLGLFPEQKFGQFVRSEMMHKLRFNNISCDVLFRALDSAADIKKLLSLEVTFIFVNEAREINFEIISMLPRRLRYPSHKINPNSFKCMIMDSNPPDTDHWWYRTFEEQKPVGWKIFRQPGGLAKNAENTENLPDGYYTKQMSGADENWLKVYRDGEYGFTRNSYPVYSQYNDSIHCQEVKVTSGLITIGLDFGLTPAAVFCQRDAQARWVVFDELCTWDTAAYEFAELLNDKIKNDYPNCKYEFFADPSGNQRSSTDGKTVFEVLRNHNINALPANTNSTFWRKETLKKILSKITKGTPAIIIDPACKTLRKGLIGGYHYQKSPYDEKTKIVKNKYSHPVEALEYALVGKNPHMQEEKHAPSLKKINYNWQLY